MVMKFPDATCQPLLMFDASLKDPTVVVLSDDIEIPGRHEIVQAARIINPIISESILEPNFDLAEKGVFVASVLVKPKEQTVPIQIINPGVDTVKLYKGTNIGCLQQFDVKMNDPVLDPGGNADSSSQQCELNFDLENLKPDERKLMDIVLRESKHEREKVKAIKEYPVPKDLTELRRFIGMISYYRRFILRFSDVASPLHRLLQKDVKFEWNNNCQESFEDLKEQLISSPILGFPDTNKDYVLYTDASDVGIGAVLTQKDKDGAEKVISFASKAFSSAEKNWTTTEKEAFAVVWALQYFHPYVYGRHVLVFTDHRALQWIKGMKHPNGKLALDELQELQDLDEDLSRVKGWIREGSRPEQKPRNGTDVLYALYNIFDSLSIENDLLSRSWEDDTGKERYQVVLPKFIAPTILKEAHEQIGFFKSVENFCACCEICAKNKTVPRPHWPFKPIKVVPIPFYMIGVDLIGPLKTIRSGNKYILSVIDYYTKYAEAKALPNQEAETIVRALEEIFARHGMPSVLLTDQGRNFESHLMKSVCQLFGIEKRRTTAYHPQTDGLCEGFNGVLKALLRMKVNCDKNDWDEQLPHALLAYRVSKQSSTGVTPFEMLYGRDIRLPLGTEQEELLAKPTHGPAKYLEDLRKRQDNIRKIVIERLKKAQQKQKRNYDSKYCSQQSKIFHIGDTVLLKNFRARGLEEKFIGPYIIVGVQEGNYEIESLKDKKRKIVHFNSIKPFKIDQELEGIPQKADELYGSESEMDDSIFEIEDPRPLEIRREREIENIQP
eukprot:gene14624-16139_t